MMKGLAVAKPLCGRAGAELSATGGKAEGFSNKSKFIEPYRTGLRQGYGGQAGREQHHHVVANA